MKTMENRKNIRNKHALMMGSFDKYVISNKRRASNFLITEDIVSSFIIFQRLSWQVM